MLVGMACEVHINAQKPQRPHADVFLEHIRKFQARTVAAKLSDMCDHKKETVTTSSICLTPSSAQSPVQDILKRADKIEKPSN